MKITWLGHSCFILEESTGTTVVTDPYSNEIIGYEMKKVSANAVTVSHPHNDHNATINVSGNPKIIDTVGFWELAGVDISSVLSVHDGQNGKERGNNLIFKYRMDGIDICHMGDVGEECTVRLAESIGSIDVLMIPVGGNYTIDALQAKEYIDFLMPSFVIPMHFRTPSSKIDVDKLDEFLDLFETNQLVKVDGDTITLDRSSFENDDETKVIVFSEDLF